MEFIQFNPSKRIVNKAHILAVTIINGEKDVQIELSTLAGDSSDIGPYLFTAPNVSGNYETIMHALETEGRLTNIFIQSRNDKEQEKAIEMPPELSDEDLQSLEIEALQAHQQAWYDWALKAMKIEDKMHLIMCELSHRLSFYTTASDMCLESGLRLISGDELSIEICKVKPADFKEGCFEPVTPESLNAISVFSTNDHLFKPGDWVKDFEKAYQQALTWKREREVKQESARKNRLISNCALVQSADVEAVLNTGSEADIEA